MNNNHFKRRVADSLERGNKSELNGHMSTFCIETLEAFSTTMSDEESSLIHGEIKAQFGKMATSLD